MEVFYLTETHCAYCNKSIYIKSYLIKERNFCCRDHYHKYARQQFEKTHTIICDNCHKPFVYDKGTSHFNRSSRHYCSIKCLSEHNRRYEELHNRTNKRYKIWCGLKKRAKLKGFEFNLELSDIPEIPEFCPVLGIPIIPNDGAHCPTDNSPSVDRIDSTKGYIKGNVHIISNRANRIKSDATIDELRMVLNDYENIVKPKTNNSKKVHKLF